MLEQTPTKPFGDSFTKWFFVTWLLSSLCYPVTFFSFERLQDEAPRPDDWSLSKYIVASFEMAWITWPWAVVVAVVIFLPCAFGWWLSQRVLASFGLHRFIVRALIGLGSSASGLAFLWLLVIISRMHDDLLIFGAFAMFPLFAGGPISLVVGPLVAVFVAPLDGVRW